MKKQFFALLLLLFCTSAIYASVEDILKNVERSARTWLELVDSGEYLESWKNSSDLLRGNRSESDWIKSITATRAPHGSVDARYIATAAQSKTWPDLPDGEYIILQFYITLSIKGLAMETVTLSKQSDGTWLVADYSLD
ncbi:MAG: DUF4019 domain-containing protein [Nitrosomonas sp.]|nr:DUF4019 domain-containing protein [Nitrosomonas sp.]